MTVNSSTLNLIEIMPLHSSNPPARAARAVAKFVSPPSALRGVVVAAALLLMTGSAFCQFPFPVLIRNHVPESWQAAEVRWIGDRTPHNKIDDLIDAKPDGDFAVIVNYNRCLEDADLEKLRALGPNVEVQMRSHYLATVFARGLTKGQVEELAKFPEVAFIELQQDFDLHLNVSVPAICVTAGPCSPNTVQEAYPTITGAGVNIAIIDSGVDDGVHDTLPAAKFVAGYNAITHVFENPNDVLFHGTHVASIALGQAGAVVSRGVAPGAGLIDIKVTDTASFPPTRICEALETVYDNRVAWNVGVINMSLGSSVASDGTDALSQLVDLAEAMGIVVVISAGNSGPGNVGIGSPGAATRAITVAAVETMNTPARGDDGIACFSSRGPRTSDGDADSLDELKPEVSAPGTHIDVAVPTCMGGSGTGINAARWNTANGAVRLEGTSMAAPHVAGLAALIIQARPGINPASVKALMISTATPIGPASMPAVDPSWNNASGWGEVNGFAAVNVAAQTDLTYPHCPPSPGWLSPDITTSALPPQVGVPTTVTVVVTNRGPAAATGARIHFGVHVFSAATPTFHDIGTRIVNIPAFSSLPVSISWTPQNASHQCLKAEIGYGPDTDYSNNSAQRNITVQMSPAAFTVANTLTEEPATIRLVTQFEGSNQPWPFEMSQRQLVLGAADCPQTVQVEMYPPASARAGERRTLHVAAIVDTPFGPVTLGGVSVMAIKPTPGLNISRAEPGKLRICWPSPSTGFTLECTRSLTAPTEWSDVDAPVEIIGGMNCVTLDISDFKRFYRLRSGCVEFSGLKPGAVPNPWDVEGFLFDAHDASGGSLPDGRLQEVGSLIGLDCGFSLSVTVPDPCLKVELSLLRFNSATCRIVAYDSANKVVATATLSGVPGVPETVLLDGAGQRIARVVIAPTQDETLLLKFCCVPDGPPTGAAYNPFEEPVDAYNGINELMIDPKGQPSGFARSMIPADAFTREPIEPVNKPDSQTPPPGSKISPILDKWVASGNPNDPVEILITFQEDMRIPLMPDLAAGEDRDKPGTRRAGAIAELGRARAQSQRLALERLQQYAGGAPLEPMEFFWIVNTVQVRTLLGAVGRLQESPEVVYLQPAAGDEEPPDDGNPNNDAQDARVLIVSDPYFNLGLTQPWIGLLDTGIRPTHVVFNSPSHIAWLRDCVNGGPNCNATGNPGYDPTDFAWNHGTSTAGIITGNNRLGNAWRGVTEVRLDSWQIYTAAGLSSSAAVRGIQGGVAAFDKVLVGEIQAAESETGAIATAADNAYDAGLIFVSANGNFGPDSSTVRSPGIAHKVIGVGGFMTETQAQYGNQGRGPATDGRYKPDIQAPTWSETAANGSDTAMQVFTGTSGATPYASAAAMLARNWLRTFGTYDNGQTYAMMILYGQNPWPYDNTQGAGPLKMAVNSHAWWGKVAVANGANINIPITIGSGRQNFNGALWWPERASQSHNDLDLHLIDPSGVERARGFSAVSIFERAQVSGALAAGTWKLRIRGYSVPTGAQVVYWAATINN
jgi:subtilisin family serine protease